MTVVERAPFFIGSSAGELFQWEIVKNIMLKPETKIPEKAADQKLDVAKTCALSRICGKLKTTFQKDTTEVLGLRKCNDNSFANWSLDSEIKVLGKIDGNTPAKCITMTADRQIMYLATGEGNLWQYDVNHQHEPISFGKVAIRFKVEAKLGNVDLLRLTALRIFSSYNPRVVLSSTKP